ncbi:MAG: ABC transporter substrate-binding protein [Pseudomonadota bacterium]|nr:ABC transporter substrate-binding protein [Gammaproteobacteria bacterium]MDQ3581181.1 ABC transporter substrate-binding protein [Pseudomonadota bacterium]
MKTPRFITVITGLCLVLSGTSHAAESLNKIKVAHWGHEKILIYAPLYIAMDGGFFEKEGLDIELVYSGNDDQVFATVLSGAASFGIGDPAFTAISREKGGEGKVVAALVGRVANWAVAKDPAIQPFTDPKKLNGLRVTSFPSPSTTFTILSGLKRDLNLSKMVIKQLAFGTEQAALERGEADLAIMLEPQASVAESQGFRVVWSLAEYYGDFALTGVTAIDSFIKNERDTVQRFVNALQNALTFIGKSPEAAAGMLGKSFPTLSAAIVQSATKRMVEDKTIPRTAVINKKAWLKTLNIRKTMGDLKSMEIADACLDSSFAEKAVFDPKPLHHDSPTAEPPTAAPPTAAPPTAEPDFPDSSLGWSTLGFWADVSSLVGLLSAAFSLAIVAKTLLEHRKGHVAWNKLSEFEQNCGRIIANCFANSVDRVEKDKILRALTDNHRIEQSAANDVLAKYLKIGLIEEIGKTGTCKPLVTPFAKLVPLFQLFR